MLKSLLNTIYQAGAASKRFITLWLFLTVLLGLNLWVANPTAAQEPPSGHTVYLPLVVKSPDAAPPTNPYAQMLQRVQQVCAVTGLNQVCYANGQITLQPKTGTIDFNQPGDIADLAKVQSLNLTSNGADSQKWGVAWLRLRVNSDLPDQELTILAFGNVQLSNMALFENQVKEGDVTLPSLQFASSPVSGATKQGSSGLVVTNPTEEDLFSLSLNGAVITLGSTAFVEAQPGSQMKAIMVTGTSLIEAKDQQSTAIKNEQVSVPLAPNGQVSGSPTPAAPVTDDLFVPLTLIMDKEEADAAFKKLNRAIRRCQEGRSAYVYNVLYWTRIIEIKPLIKANIDPAKLAQAYSQAEECLNFELFFDSTVTIYAGPITRKSHVYASKVMLEFSPKGDLDFGGIEPLNYLSYTYQSPDPCTITTQTTDGKLEIIAGSLKIARDSIRISTEIKVTNLPTDQITKQCPKIPPQVIPTGNWSFGFYYVHLDLQGSENGTFRFKDWNYKGGKDFADILYARTRPTDSLTIETVTDLILEHSPFLPIE